jgi:biopolymer transport protein ExbD
MGGGGNEVNADPNLTPLLDVVLQLIMFFMITVNFAAERMPGGINLPVAQSMVPRDKKDDKDKPKEKIDGVVVINMNDKEEFINIAEFYKIPVTRERLRLYFISQLEPFVLKARSENRDKPRVTLVVRADEEVRYSRIFDVIEASRQAGIENYQLRVVSKPQSDRTPKSK